MNNINNNNKIFEIKSVKVEKDLSEEVKDITIIKTIKKSEIFESSNLVNDNYKFNTEIKTPEKKEKRKPSYSERRKLFQTKNKSSKKNQE